MKKYFLGLCALAVVTTASAWDYPNKVSSGVALIRDTPGPLDFTSVFLSQADLDYYITKGTTNSTAVSAAWKGVTNILPFNGQVVTLAIPGKSPVMYVINEQADGTFKAVASLDEAKKDISAVQEDIKDINSRVSGIGNMSPVYKPVYDKGIWKTNETDLVLSATDGTVAIGDNAHATETAASAQSVAIGRDALATGAATVAVGPNSFTEKAQSVAVGWRANAVGEHSVAVGSARLNGQDYYKDGAKNPNSDLLLAEGNFSVAIGYNGKALGADSIAMGRNAKATASNSVQIGTGVNDLPNSLKFGDTFIVKEGNLVGGSGDAEELNDDNIVVTGGDVDLRLRQGANVTIVPIKSMEDVDAIYLTPENEKTKRNFILTLSNEEGLREALPITLECEHPSDTMKMVIKDQTRFVSKLPAQIKTEQAYSKLVIGSIQEFDDDTDWEPVIEKLNVRWEFNAAEGGRFVSIGSDIFRGYNLHCGKSLKLTYPIDPDTNGGRTTFTTNLLTTVGKDGWVIGTTYRSVGFDEFKPVPQLSPDVNDQYTLTVEYETVNGVATITETHTVNEDPGVVRIIPRVEWASEGDGTTGSLYVRKIASGGAPVYFSEGYSEISVIAVAEDDTETEIPLTSSTFEYTSSDGVQVVTPVLWTGAHAEFGTIPKPKSAKLKYKTVDNSKEKILEFPMTI